MAVLRPSTMPGNDRSQLTEGTLSAMAIRRRRVSCRYRNVTGFFALQLDADVIADGTMPAAISSSKSCAG